MTEEREEPIRVRGARVHNLKGVDCEIPRSRLVVITGPSGSGKSSLAFDTLYAEGQRRYVSTLSPFARRFLEEVESPDVDEVTGLCPAVAIDQRALARHPRSTVGTASEVFDHLRVLFAALGRSHCPRCGAEVSSQSADGIAERLARYPEGTALAILAPVVRDRKGAFAKEMAHLAAAGQRRARVDGKAVDLRDPPRLDPRKRHRIDVLVDRLVVRVGARGRILAGLQKALDLAEDVVRVSIEGLGERLLSRRKTCLRCDISLPPPEPRSFSFASPEGACPACRGLGVGLSVDPATTRSDAQRAALEARLDSVLRPAVHAPDDGGDLLELRPYLREETCDACAGLRLREESLAVRLAGVSVREIARVAVGEGRRLLGGLSFPERERPVAARVLPEVLSRLAVLDELGLGHLTLDRALGSLSFGEAKRIRLATQIGARMQGLLYVLDEPSVGLHPRDSERLLHALKRVRDEGNTVVVVEHDLGMIRAADWVLDLGEGAGRAGGRLLFQGPPGALDGSLTGRYLRGELGVVVPRARRPARGSIRIRGARARNLKGIDVTVPLCALTVVTGVSGSGKSSLVEDVLQRALEERLRPKGSLRDRVCTLEGGEAVDRVIAIDQSPIGRSPRSNPASFTGAFAHIREIFSRLPEARARGFGAGRFSFNLKGGRCPSCQGNGMRAVELGLLPTAYVKCEACLGSRYDRETLSVRFKGRNVAEVLDLTSTEAHAFLGAHPRLDRILATLVDVGLGYLPLGQSALTLSGGEAQRLRLARDLARPNTGRTLYILDEPTTGLHPADVAGLLDILHRLLEAGNTVVVIEHNLDVIKVADHVIDLGPEAGEAGGRLVVEGPPEVVAACVESHTGRFLAPLLSPGEPPGRRG